MTVLRYSHLGYSLIELLIVAAISMLVVGGAIAGFVNFSDRQQVLNIAKEVQQLMRTAQSKARVRDTPTAGCGALQSYEVAITNSSASLNAICLPAAVVVVKTFNYPATITASSDQASTLSLRFTTLEGGVTKADGSAYPDTTTYTFASGSNSFSFRVTPSGSISNVN